MARRIPLLPILLLALAARLAAADTPLEVVQRAPEGDLESLDAANEVVVTFNRPMVALSAGEDSGKFCPCQISPSLAGRCRWRGTNTLAYEFASPPGPGHSFKVTIPQGTRSQVGGDSLKDDVTFSFNTQRPQVRDVYPPDGSRWLGLHPSFYVHFDLSVTPSVGQAELASDGGHLVPLRLVELNSAQMRKDHAKGLHTDVGASCWGCANQILELLPAEALQPGTHYKLTLKAGWPAVGGEGGDNGLKGDQSYGYDTYGPFSALGVEDYSECSTRGRINFSNPVLEEHLDQFVKVSPAVKVDAWTGDGPRYEGRPDYDNKRQWHVPFEGWNFKPQTHYHFTVLPGLKDVFGNALGAQSDFDWTSPALCADVEATSGFGVLESYLPPKHPLDATNQPSVALRYKTVKADQAVPAYLASGGRYGQQSNFDGFQETSWPVPASPNVRTHSYIDLSKLLGQGLGSFTMLAVKSQDEGKDHWTTSMDDRTDLGLTLKSSPDSSLIWTTDLRLGSPRGGVAVELRDPDNKLLWKGQTDGNGLAQGPGWRGLGITNWERWQGPRIFALAYSPDGVALLDSQFRDGIEPWRFRLAYGGYENAEPRVPRKYEVFTDRGVYRPGESVHFKGWVRDLVGGDWVLPGGFKSLDVQVHDGRDRLVLTGTASIGREGGFDFAFDLAKNAPTGTWSLRPLRAQADGASGEDPNFGEDSNTFDQSFRVEAVKAATYEVGLSGLKPWLGLGRPLSADVEGHYLAGAGMPGALGDWTLTVTPSQFSPEGWDGWTFELPYDDDFSDMEDDDTDQGAGDRYESRRPRLAGSGSFTLDASSRAHLNVATQGLGQCSPCEALLEVNLSSPDRQKLFVRGTVQLHQGQAYPGFRAKDELGRVGQPYAAQCVVLDPDGKPAAGMKLGLRLIREVKQSVRAVGAFGRLEWRSDTLEQDAGHWDLKSGSAPVDWSFTPSAPGRYRLLLTAVDADGHSQQAGTYVYIYGPGEATWGHDESDMVELIPDKAEYKVGDTAHVVVKSPYASATALVTLEREGVQQAMVRTLGSADAVDIPITESMLPNIYVGVALSEGRALKRAFGPDGDDLAKPQSRFGYAALKVLPLARRLSVTASADKAEYRPGGDVKASALVLDDQGRPADAEVTLYAVDEGVLQLTHYETPDPFSFFYGPRPLWISTSDNRLMVIGTRNFGEKGQDSGGGGGDVAMPGMEGMDLRRHFETLAFWKADLRTDKDGRAAAAFKLPDNLTRFRLIAVAASGSRFGSGDTGLKVAKGLVLRPSLPRFARLGDHVQAGVTVQNASTASGNVTVEIASDGRLGLKDAAPRQLSLGPGEAKELRWDMDAGSLGNAVLDFKAKGHLVQDESDGLEWRLPVEQPEKAAHAATSGVVDGPAVEEALARPSNALSGTTAVRVDLASTAMLGLQGGVGYLLDYPHLCLEQRLSKILPAVVGPDLLEAFHLGLAKDQSAAAQAVLDAMPQFQAGDGGYRYWTDADGKSDPWLTAYALEVAAMAKDAGFKVPKASLALATDWLRNNYDRKEAWGYPYSDEERDVLKAWALYALQRQGVQMPGLYSELYGRRAQLPLYSLADLLRTAPAQGTPDQARELAQMLLNQAKVDARVLHFEESHADRFVWVHASTESVTGFCLDALLTAQGGFAGDDKAARWLVEARGKDGAWGDTQSNAWALMGLARYFRVHEKDTPDFKATVSEAGQPLMDAAFQGRSLQAQTKEVLEQQLFSAGGETRLNLAKEGTGRLYYSLLLNWTPGPLSQPDFEGFQVERSYATLDGRTVGSTLQAGQRYLVTLKVRSNQDREFVALTDFLPAGCEVVDSSFATESQAAAPAGGGDASNDDPWGDWWGRFQRHENYDDRVQVYADFLSAGEHLWKYTVQATTPGSFSQPAAWVEMMYQPETYGRTAGARITVEAPKP